METEGQAQEGVRDYVTPEEAAQITGLCRKTIYQACRSRGLRHTRPSGERYGQIRIKRSWLHDWMLKASEINH